jgi:hypothetical protein
MINLDTICRSLAKLYPSEGKSHCIAGDRTAVVP